MELLDCQESDVRRLVDNGELEAHGIGKRGVRIYLDSLAQYQARKARAPKRPVDKVVKSRAASHVAHLAAEAELRKSGIIS